jgi:hypothetical protein
MDTRLGLVVLADHASTGDMPDFQQCPQCSPRCDRPQPGPGTDHVRRGISLADGQRDQPGTSPG